jgi:hypothetical protein
MSTANDDVGICIVPLEGEEDGEEKELEYRYDLFEAIKNPHLTEEQIYIEEKKLEKDLDIGQEEIKIPKEIIDGSTISVYGPPQKCVNYISSISDKTVKIEISRNLYIYSKCKNPKNKKKKKNQVKLIKIS